jgi:hypothetical protein
MAYWNTPLAREFMRQAAETAGTIGIRARLRGWSQGVGLDVLRGTIRISQTAESLSLGFATTGGGGSFGMSRDDMLVFLGKLVDRWDRAWRYLKNTTGKDPLDIDVYTLMMNDDPTDPDFNQDHALRPILGFLTDFSYMIK